MHAQKQQYLSFVLGGEEYAIDIRRVREVSEYGAVTRVPGMPASIRGVMNLRGLVTPVIDLGAKFGFAPSEVTKWTCIVLAEIDLDGENSAIGIVADSVSQLIELSTAEVEPVPTFGTRIRADFLLGMASTGKKFTLLLDLNRLLTPDELVAVSSTRAEGDTPAMPAKTPPLEPAREAHDAERSEP